MSEDNSFADGNEDESEQEVEAECESSEHSSDEGVDVIEEDIRAYAQSFSSELKSKKDRVENLIGSRHEKSVGDYRESLIREQIRRSLPDRISVSTGFVLMIGDVDGDLKKLQSRQIDVLLWDSSNYTAYFEDGDFVIISPEACVGALEVTKTLSGSKLRTDLEKIDSVLKVSAFTNLSETKIFTGVIGFQYDPEGDETLLDNALRYYCEEHPDRYHAPDQEEELDDAWFYERSRYVDVVVSLDTHFLKFMGGERSSCTVYNFTFDSFEGAFARFEGFLRRFVVTDGRPAVHGAVRPTESFVDSIRGDGELTAWTFLECHRERPDFSGDLDDEYKDKYHTYDD